MAQLIEKVNHLDNNIVELQLKGYIDGSNVKEIKEKITGLVNENKSKIILKMKNVEFVSANAWKTINDLNKEIKSIKGSIKILNLKKEIEGIFHLLEYDKKIEYYKNKEKIVKSFDSKETFEPHKIKSINRDIIDNLTDIKNSSLQDKIKRILSTHSNIQLLKLKDILSHPVYNEKTNFLKLYLNKKQIEKEMEN
ncbi:MAG: STAS domain-containing protein [Candidatus Mcinerneyibacterium aminivorans]|uniref:STAS domain-containing protein n=1 Tax=Candidatus Mcinerneyibacterium aminivorans TaxID=2703815 RepID=A0A5D0MDL5_9BACT|nr:MAG: STAS domain-containing protein [Candidatus Mcinerneyibacterium aminivorans]